MQKINEKRVKDQKYSNKSFQTQQEVNKLQQQNIDIQSMSSSSNSVQTRLVFENIHKKSQMRYLKIINAFGILSALAILSLTLLAFFNFLTSLVSQRENFKYINWIYMINVQISYSLSEHNIILLNQQNLLSTPAGQYQPFMDLLNEQKQSRISLSKQHMNLLYNNTNKDIEVFNIIQNNYIIQNIYQSNTISQQQNLSMIYSILLQIFGIFYFVSNNDPLGIIKKQNELNYPALNEKVQSVFSQMNDNYQNQLSSIKSQSLIQLYVITFIMLLFLISVIPSYIFSKKKQQQILELFATFDRLQLKDIIDQITHQLQFYSIDQKQNVIKYENKVSNRQFQNHHANSEKKLNISKTSSLKYSLKKLIVALILIFCSTTIYPIINYFIVKQFIDNSIVIYNFNNVVCASYFAVLNSLRARQGLAMAFLIPQQQALSIQTYQGILNQLSVQINELPNLLKENLEKICSTSLHNQEIFDDFLTNVFTNNACDTINKYTQYQNGDFLFDQCNTVGKGSLKSGLLN
ncbi:transmembrane protein, putative, partial (macronuclear) [Tetrahymena thermophila SB210]